MPTRTSHVLGRSQDSHALAFWAFPLFQRAWQLVTTEPACWLRAYVTECQFSFHGAAIDPVPGCNVEAVRHRSEVDIPMGAGKFERPLIRHVPFVPRAMDEEIGVHRRLCG